MTTRKLTAMARAVEGGDPSAPYEIEVIASTGEIARDGDVIDAAGWRLENYQLNPVILDCHDYSRLPVGKAVRVWVEGDKLMARIQFASRDVYEHGWRVGEMYRTGLLNAVSVGWRPLAYEPLEGSEHGRRYTESELLEISAVPVPADPQAVATLRSFDPDALRDAARAVATEIQIRRAVQAAVNTLRADVRGGLNPETGKE